MFKTRFKDVIEIWERKVALVDRTWGSNLGIELEKCELELLTCVEGIDFVLKLLTHS